MGLIPESVAKYFDEELPILSDQVGTMQALHSLAWKLDKDIKSAQSGNSSTEKVTPAFDKQAASDMKAKATARKLVSAYLAAIEKETTANPNVAYWLSEIGKSVTQFTTSEVNFYRWQTDKTSGVKVSANADAVAAMKSDRRDVVSFAKKLLTLLTDTVDELAKVDSENNNVEGYRPLTKKGKDGKPQIDLPNIQGRGSGTDTDSPAGKFASLSFMVFTVNDETFPVGTDSRIVLRSIFTGAERIGKRPGDLYDAMIKANGGNTPKQAGDTVEFTLNGKKVRAVRTSLTADELPDMESDDDDSPEE